ncbi:hypothetical protein J6590_023710 [Homalodisca vitripennis]|nr:hypothetical protein J6590_023710 [Homalodisca vitripennis]
MLTEPQTTTALHSLFSATHYRSETECHSDLQTGASFRISCVVRATRDSAQLIFVEEFPVHKSRDHQFRWLGHQVRSELSSNTIWFPLI